MKKLNEYEHVCESIADYIESAKVYGLSNITVSVILLEDVLDILNEHATLQNQLSVAMSENQRLTKHVEDYEEENAALKRAVQAAIDYFTDGITSKEQYDAYLRFVDAAQPFFVVAMAAEEQDDAT